MPASAAAAGASGKTRATTGTAGSEGAVRGGASGPSRRGMHNRAGPARRAPMRKTRFFTRLAKAASRFTGRPLCFMLAVLVVLCWIITGPLFGFSDTWQLVINTGTTIVTFLMVFLIQNTQNRDTE